VNIAKSNSLSRYIHDKCVPPKQVDEFDIKAIQEELDLWLRFEAGDANMQLAITMNYKALPLQVCQGKKTALEMWKALQH
jgi:hypothetical protein